VYDVDGEASVAIVGEEKAHRPDRFRFSAQRLVLWTAAGTAMLCIGCCVLTDRLVTRADRRALRDPDTGILVGAEPRDLGPAGAEMGILLVHGFIGAGNNFNDLPERLAERGWRVRVMLLPGHGTSPRDFMEVGPDELLDAVLAELSALRANHSRVVLVGHSMGGSLCVLVAAQEDVDGIVLGAPYFGVTYRWYYILPAELWTKLASPFMRWVPKGRKLVQVNRKEVMDQIVSYRWTPLPGVMTLIELGRQAGDPAVLGRVRCPVLLIHSHGDNAASPKAAAEAFRNIGSTNKRAVWLETSNHVIYWDFEREQVAEEILRFVESIDKAESVSASPE